MTGTQLWRRPSRSRGAGRAPRAGGGTDALGRPPSGGAWTPLGRRRSWALLRAASGASSTHTGSLGTRPGSGLARCRAALRDPGTPDPHSHRPRGRGLCRLPRGRFASFPSVGATRSDQVVPLARPQRLRTSVPGLWERTSTRHRKCEQRASCASALPAPRRPPRRLRRGLRALDVYSERWFSGPLSPPPLRGQFRHLSPITLPRNSTGSVTLRVRVRTPVLEARKSEDFRSRSGFGPSGGSCAPAETAESGPTSSVRARGQGSVLPPGTRELSPCLPG